MTFYAERCSAVNILASPGAEESMNIIASNWTYSASTNSSFVVDIHGNNNNNNNNNSNNSGYNNDNNNSNVKEIINVSLALDV